MSAHSTAFGSSVFDLLCLPTLQDREETLSRAYLPRDGAACYVLRDPPVSPPTTHLDCPCACMLCGDEGSGERLVAVRRCGHVLCGDCVASHAKARVESHPGNPVRTHA